MKTYTQEQLDAMSEYEINCAVAEKLGYTVSEPFDVEDCTDVILEHKGYGSAANYCNDLRDYMPIAINNEITIEFENGRVMTCDQNAQVHSEFMPKAETGRAVITAFLLMNIQP